MIKYWYLQFSSVQSLNRVRLFATLWIAARQASLSITISRVHSNSRPSSRWCHPTISSSCHLLLLLPPIPPSIRVFSNELTLRMRWPKYWSFSFSIISSKEQASFNFEVAVTIHSDFGAQENNTCHCFHCSPSICHELMGLASLTWWTWVWVNSWS